MRVKTIKFRDIANHPNLSLSVKDYIEEKTLKIDKDLAYQFQEFLDMEDVNIHDLNLKEDSTIETFTVRFQDGFEADIKVCAGNHNFFIDPVLFNENGHEVCTLDVEGNLLGEYIFEENNKQYIVDLVI